MRCSCGNQMPYTSVSKGRGCPACSLEMQPEVDDFLLHGMNGLVREVRQGQIDMGRTVDRAVRERKITLIEAPVGTGKTLGYMVPAILEEVTRAGLLVTKPNQKEKTPRVTEGGRIVVATATKVLQKQIAGTDLPMLHDKLDHAFFFSLLKGKSNYGCYQKLPDLDPPDRKLAKEFLDDSVTGDVSDFPGGRPKFWSDMTAEDCIGVSCHHVQTGTCPYWMMKQQAQLANVVVANHALVAFDFRFGPRTMLGQYDVLIVDEAHKFQEALRGAWSQQIRAGAADRILRMSDKAGIAIGVGKQLDDAWKGMFASIERLEGEVPPDPFGALGRVARETLLKIHDATITGSGGWLSKTATGNATMLQPPKNDEDLLRTTLRKFILCRNIERLYRALVHSKSPTKNEFVHVVVERRNRKVFRRVEVTPIDVGTLCGPRFYQIPTVILTSATIALGGDFTGIKMDLGVNWHPKLATPPNPIDQGAEETESDEEVTVDDIIVSGGPVDEEGRRHIEELSVESPFDFARQAALYIPKHIPMPCDRESANRENYIYQMALEIKKLLTASQGNAFVLFTATNDLDDVYAEVQNLGYELPIVLQGDDVDNAIRTYRATPHSTIFGLKSFWEGVSIEGDKLHLVIIAKLPFPNPRDAVMKARSRRLEEELKAKGIPEHEISRNIFKALSIPQMLTEMRQGAGRLIRTKTDLGILAVLDPRIWTGSASYAPKPEAKRPVGYGAQAVKAIGFTQQTDDFQIIAGLLSKFILLEARRVAKEQAAQSVQSSGSVSEPPGVSEASTESE